MDGGKRVKARDRQKQKQSKKKNEKNKHNERLACILHKYDTIIIRWCEW